MTFTFEVVVPVAAVQYVVIPEGEKIVRIAPDNIVVATVTARDIVVDQDVVTVIAVGSPAGLFNKVILGSAVSCGSTSDIVFVAFAIGGSNVFNIVSASATPGSSNRLNLIIATFAIGVVYVRNVVTTTTTVNNILDIRGAAAWTAKWPLIRI